MGSYRGTYDRTIFHNPGNRYCVVVMKTADPSIPEAAREKRRYPDHLLRFTAVGYGIPFTDAVELALEGEWADSRYGLQLQVEDWTEVIPKTEEGILGYLESGLVKGIGEKTAKQIVERFGTDALDILENSPLRLLEIKGITEKRLKDILSSYTENRMLRDLMVLLAPFKLTPKAAMKIYGYFGPACIGVLKKSPYGLCKVPGFGFRKVDDIVLRMDYRPRDPMRLKGALYYALQEAKGKQGHLYLEKEVLYKTAMQLLNEKAPGPEQRVPKGDVVSALEEMVLMGEVVSLKEMAYLSASFAQEDETARWIAEKLAFETPPQEDVSALLDEVKQELGFLTSAKQEKAIKTAFWYNLSIITGSPGTGKTTVLKMILELYRRRFPENKIMLMAPTGRASRRMAESTGFEGAGTLHSGLGLVGEEGGLYGKEKETLNADLVIIDEMSMVDMWLAEKFFTALRGGTKVVLVGDIDQLPSVGAGNVFKELIACGLIPVTVLDEIFRQAKDSLIAHNARLIHEGNTRLYYGNDFTFLPCENQAGAAAAIVERYCKEIQESSICQVQILSPFRSEGEASAGQLNEVIREIVNPFCSAEEEIRAGTKVFRIGDRVMQTKNRDKVSNGDLGFIRSIEDTGNGKVAGIDFGEGRRLEYRAEDLANVDLAYATTIHKSMGSEYDTVIIPVIKAHYIMLYRNLLYTAVTRAKKRVILVGQKSVLFMAIHRNELTGRNTLLGERAGLYYKAFMKKAGNDPAVSNGRMPKAG